MSDDVNEPPAAGGVPPAGFGVPAAADPYAVAGGVPAAAEFPDFGQGTIPAPQGAGVGQGSGWEQGPSTGPLPTAPSPIVPAYSPATMPRIETVS